MEIFILEEKRIKSMNVPTKRQLKQLGLWDGLFFRLSQSISRIGFTMLLKGWCRLQIHGQEEMRGLKQCIFAPTHASHLDFWATLEGAPKPLRQGTFVAAAKDHFYKHPIRWFITKLGSYHNFPFDRQALTPSLYRQLLAILRSDLSLLMFAQGSRTRDGQLMAFKPLLAMLAIEAQVPIVPVAVKGTFQALPPGATFVKRYPVRVCFGKPIYPEPIDLSDSRNHLPKAARELNQKLMNTIEELWYGCEE